MKYGWFGIIVWLLLVPAVVLAEGFLDKLQVHGFASQAVINTSANSWFGDSAQTSFGFTELGLNGSVRAHRRLLLAGQVLSRRAGEMYDGTPSLDYALADWTVLTSPEYRLGLRLGRIKNPLGLYNETRDVPFTRPSIFLPQVVYFDKVRNLFLSSDGVILYTDLYKPFGNVSLQVGGGRTRLDDNVRWAYLGDFKGQLQQEGVAGIASVWYTTPLEQLRVGWSGVYLNMNFDPADNTTFTLAPGETSITFWLASIQYNAKHWSLVAEYAREPIAWHDYGPLFPDTDRVAEGYYVQGVLRPNASLELVARYAEGYFDRGDRDGSELAIASGGMLPSSVAFSKILTAGLRWEFARNWLLRAEYQRHAGNFILSARENKFPSDYARNWHLFAILGAFRF